MGKTANKQHSFLVDIGKTMIDTNRISSEGKDSQRLYCKCGAQKDLKTKARRLVVKKHDTTVEDKHSIESVKCDKCSTVYNQVNKLILISPDDDEIYKINFRTEEKGDSVFLYREKMFARYDSSKDKFDENIVRVDYLKFNKETKKTVIFLSKPTLDKSMATQKQSDNNDITEDVGLTKIARLEHFMHYFDFAFYTGLANIFEFFNKIDGVVADLDQIKKLIAPINFTYNNKEIFEKTNANGEVITYSNVDTGFGDGKRKETQLNIGGYLHRFLELSRVFLCVADYPSITTILLTKGQVFFKEFLQSKNLLSSAIYQKLDATSPLRILEISMNYDSNGALKGVTDEIAKKAKIVDATKAKDIEEDSNYLRVSPLIYKNITSPADMDILLSMYRKKYVTKTDMETLFQNYEQGRLYVFYRNLDKQRIDERSRITLKHIKHIFDRNIDNVTKGQNSDFLHLYTDTLNTMDLLELLPNYIYKIKSNKELKEVHDDLAARYGAIKDAKKAEFYKKSIKDIEHINVTIDDIKFTVVPTLEDLNKEGMTMGHCVYTYLDRVVNKNYVAVHVQHLLSNERATLGLMRSGTGLEFDQLKGYQNSRATSEMIAAVVEYLEEHKIKFSQNRNSDLSPASGNQKRMHDYLSAEEVMELRKKRAAKEEAEIAKAKAEGREYVPQFTENGQHKRKKGIFGNFFNS